MTDPAISPPAGIRSDDEAWHRYASDPLPGWASSSMGLFDCRRISLAECPQHCGVAVYSVPFDGTASTRTGARHGAAAIRQATLAYSAQARSRRFDQVANMRTGDVCEVLTPQLLDFGDLHVYPADPARQVAATAAEVYRLATRSELLVGLGGEHTISYPTFVAVHRAYQDRGLRLGYVQIDNHFDFGSDSVLHGPIFHGSNARRISEIDGLTPHAIGFVGVGDFTSAEQYRQLCRDGYVVRPIFEIRGRGYETCLAEVLDRVASSVDAIYVSVDIDVCDTATAPGTGNVTVGGLSSSEFLSTAKLLQKHRIAALDVVEVNPLLDQGGGTAHLVARLLYEWLFLKPVARLGPADDRAGASQIRAAATDDH